MHAARLFLILLVASFAVPLSSADAVLTESLLSRPPAAGTATCSGIAPVPSATCTTSFDAFSRITISTSGLFAGRIRCDIFSFGGHLVYTQDIIVAVGTFPTVTGQWYAGRIDVTCRASGPLGIGAGVGPYFVDFDYS